MNPHRTTFRLPVVMAMIVALAVYSASITGAPATGSGLLQVPTASSTESSPSETPRIIQDLEPIETDGEAIARSMELFPAGHDPHDAIARLNTYSVIDAWRHAHSPDTDPGAPAWLVGILGDNLTINAILFDPSFNNGTPPWPADSVDGGFYVWDANGGWRAGRGVLSASGLSYSSLAAISSTITTITRATELPPYVAWPTSFTPPPGNSTVTPTAYPETE